MEIEEKEEVGVHEPKSDFGVAVETEEDWLTPQCTHTLQQATPYVYSHHHFEQLHAITLPSYYINKT